MGLLIFRRLHVDNVTYLEQILPTDEIEIWDRFKSIIGGKVLNQAVAVARVGGRLKWLT